MTRAEKERALAQIADEVEVCQRCPLYQSGTRGVPGEGNPDAEILFVGEGPGQKEDELGRPFVGPAGQLLEELLRSVQLTRNDVYIANVIKHRPPGNRDPLPDELEACWPYLQRQIAVIAPTLIVILGKHALDRFLPGKTISEARGRAFRVAGTVYYATYHPAAALYQGSLREVLFRDFARLPKLLKQVKRGGSDIEEFRAGAVVEQEPSTEGPRQGRLL